MSAAAASRFSLLTPQEAQELAAQPLSAPSMAAGPPPGYWRYTRSAVIGQGRETFERAVEATLTWQVLLRSGIAVAASAARAATTPPTVCRIAIPVAFLRFRGYARVTEVIAEPDRGGFTYATLPGHPVWGEESFVVGIDDGGAVTLTITACSRPHAWYARVGRPVTRRLQLRTASRFLRALR